MNFLIRPLFILFILFMAVPQKALSQVPFVAFESVYIPVENGKFIELSLWYPTSTRSSNKQLYSGGESFYVSTRKPKVYDRDYDLILISPPSYADRYSFSRLSYALAKSGFLVVNVTHNGDNWANMEKTMTASQYPARAEEIIKSIEHVRAMKKFSINPQTISVLSFEDTAFAPFLLHGEKIETRNYQNFCRRYKEDAYCNAPINQQIFRLLADIEGHVSAKKFALDYLEDENKREKAEEQARQEELRRLRARNRNAQSQEIALEIEEPIVEENKIEALAVDAHLTTYYPYIKNYIIVEPSFAFLFNRKQIHEDKYKVLAVYSTDYSTQINNELEYLSSIYPSSLTAYELDIRSGVDLTDQCAGKNLNRVTRFCSRLSHEEHEEQITALIAIVKENLSNLR